MTVEAVVVTGLGVVGPHGVGQDALCAALLAGRPVAREIDRSSGLRGRPGGHLAALVPDVDLTPWLPPAQARRLGQPSRWTVAAARMALADASLSALEGRRTAIVLSTSFGAVLYTEKLVRQILEEGPEAAQPFYFSECVANAAAGQAAIALGARGANVTLTQREAGPLLALLRGAAEILEGRADVALVGSADEMTPLLYALLDRFGAVGRAGPAPFDLHRDGMLAGEGAVVLVLERGAEAAARGARPVARVAGGGAAFDPTATESDWGTGVAGLVRALREALRRSGCAPEAIDVVVSGASGARRGDRLEGLVLRSLFPGSVPPVLAPKAVVGEYSGGVLSAGVLAMRGAAFGPIASFRTPDPDLAIAPHDGQPLPPVRRALLSSLAAGGAAAWAVLETV